MLKRVIPNADSIAERSRALYGEKLQSVLEQNSNGMSVAIEPDTESYFVAESGLHAIAAARKACPGKFFFLIRIGGSASGYITGG